MPQIQGRPDKDGVVRVDSNGPYKNYNNVIDTLWCISDSHDQIKATTVGDIWEIDLEKNTKFPLCHINTVNAATGKGELRFTFQVFVCDLVEPHESNEQEVLSDTLDICTDIVSEFKNGLSLSHNMGGGSTTFTGDHTTIDPRRYWLKDGDITYEPFTERFANAVTGWVFNLVVLVQHRYDTCYTPDEDNDCRK